jgi:2-polyprenyl-3-methyl-5-hydroxy-6-metoxy-1,4-benzoquinol methylase
MKYVGDELGLFAEARNWKETIRRQVAPFLSGSILEVGAGFGSTTKSLVSPSVNRLVCLELDPELAREVTGLKLAPASSLNIEVVVGTIDDIPESDDFDAIFYIDVLEHIKDDKAEVEKAASRLRRGGALIILSPAHEFLFSPFDKEIGHERRYTLKTLEQIRPPQLDIVRKRYLDSAGFFASLGNQ